MRLNIFEQNDEVLLTSLKLHTWYVQKGILEEVGTDRWATRMPINECSSKSRQVQIIHSKVRSDACLESAVITSQQHHRRPAARLLCNSILECMVEDIAIIDFVFGSISFVIQQGGMFGKGKN